jgi:hypothetical protein
MESYLKYPSTITRPNEKELASQMLKNNHLCIMSGAPGIGKSTEAAHFMALQCIRYDHYLWLSCQSREHILASLLEARRCIAGMDSSILFPKDSADADGPIETPAALDTQAKIDESLKILCEWLSTTESYLLVLDGADDPRVVRYLFTKNMGMGNNKKFQGDVVVTTTNETIFSDLRPFLRTPPDEWRSCVLQLKWWKEEETRKFLKANFLQHKKRNKSNDLSLSEADKAGLQSLELKCEGSPMLADIALSFIMNHNISFGTLWAQIQGMEKVLNSMKTNLAQEVMHGRADERLLMVMFHLIMASIRTHKNEQEKQLALNVLDVLRLSPMAGWVSVEALMYLEPSMSVSAIASVVRELLVIPGLLLWLNNSTEKFSLRPALVDFVRARSDKIQQPTAVIRCLLAPLLSPKTMSDPFSQKRLLHQTMELSLNVLQSLRSESLILTPDDPGWTLLEAALRLGIAESISNNSFPHACQSMKTLIDIQSIVHKTMELPRIATDLESMADMMSWVGPKWNDLHLIHQETARALMGALDTQDDVRIAKQFEFLATISRELEDTRGARGFMFAAMNTYARTFRSWQHIDVLRTCASHAALCLEDRDAVECMRYAKKALELADSMEVSSADLAGMSPGNRQSLNVTKKIKIVLEKAISQSQKKKRPDSILVLAPSVREIKERQARMVRFSPPYGQILFVAITIFQI